MSIISKVILLRDGLACEVADVRLASLLPFISIEYLSSEIGTVYCFIEDVVCVGDLIVS